MDMIAGMTVTGLIFLLVALTISVVLHELMHGVTAYWLGDTTAKDAGRLTANPLASVDPLLTIIVPALLFVFNHILFFAAKPVPFNPDRVKWDEYGAALVGLAGPATNGALAVLGAGLYRLTAGVGLIGDFAGYFVLVNVGMMVFNLIPFPPLDGSRVLYAFAPEPLQRLMERIEAFGFVAILVFVFVLFRFVAPVIYDVQATILQFLVGRSLY